MKTTERLLNDAGEPQITGKEFFDMVRDLQAYALHMIDVDKERSKVWCEVSDRLHQARIASMSLLIQG